MYTVNYALFTIPVCALCTVYSACYIVYYLVQPAVKSKQKCVFFSALLYTLYSNVYIVELYNISSLLSTRVHCTHTGKVRMN